MDEDTKQARLVLRPVWRRALDSGALLLAGLVSIPFMLMLPIATGAIIVPVLLIVAAVVQLFWDPADRRWTECPYCMAVNPRKATVCQKCGREFLQPSELAKSPPPA